MTPRRARQLDASTASFCGSVLGVCAGAMVLGSERPSTLVLVALFAAVVVAATAAALIATAYARHPASRS